MNAYEFVARLCDDLVWPVTLVVCVMILKRGLGKNRRTP